MQSSRAGKEPFKVFNHAIWLYDMNLDDIFEETHHLIVDSSLGVVEEKGDVSPSALSQSPASQ